MNLALQFGMAVRIKNHSFRPQGKNRDFRGEQKTRRYIGALEKFAAFFSAALCVFMFRKSHFCDVPSTDSPATKFRSMSKYVVANYATGHQKATALSQHKTVHITVLTLRLVVCHLSCHSFISGGRQISGILPSFPHGIH